MPVLLVPSESKNWISVTTTHVFDRFLNKNEDEEKFVSKKNVHWKLYWGLIQLETLIVCKSKISSNPGTSTRLPSLTQKNGRKKQQELRRHWRSLTRDFYSWILLHRSTAKNMIFFHVLPKDTSYQDSNQRLKFMLIWRREQLKCGNIPTEWLLFLFYFSFFGVGWYSCQERGEYPPWYHIFCGLASEVEEKCSRKNKKIKDNIY